MHLSPKGLARAFRPHGFGSQGSDTIHLHLFQIHAKFVGQSGLIEHSGLHSMQGLPWSPGRHVHNAENGSPINPGSHLHRGLWFCLSRHSALGTHEFGTQESS